MIRIFILKVRYCNGNNGGIINISTATRIYIHVSTAKTGKESEGSYKITHKINSLSTN